jgi:hypothetical protein
MDERRGHNVAKYPFHTCAGIRADGFTGMGLTDADTGAEWLQATVNQKIAVTNILSRELGGDPRDYQTCLDQIFTPGSPNLRMTIRQAVQLCRPRQ